MKYHYGGLGAANPFIRHKSVGPDDDDTLDDNDTTPSVEEEGVDTPAQQEAKEEDISVDDALAEYQKGERDWRGISSTRKERNAENREMADKMRARRAGAKEGNLSAEMRAKSRQLADQLEEKKIGSQDRVKVGDTEYRLGTDQDGIIGQLPTNYLVSVKDPRKRIYVGNNQREGYVVTEKTWHNLHGNTAMEPDQLDAKVIVVPTDRLTPSDPGSTSEDRGRVWEAQQTEHTRKRKEQLSKEPEPKWGDKGAPMRKQREAHQRERKDKGYWRAQNDEVVEQVKRKATQYKQGDYTRSLKLWSDDGGYEPKNQYSNKGDIGIASKHEKVYHTNQWELIDEDHASRYKPDSIEFTLDKLPGEREQNAYDPKTGEKLTQTDIAKLDEGTVVDAEATEGNLKQFLSDRGLREADINLVQAKDGSYTYRVTTAQGNRINPDLAERVAYELDETYGITRDKKKGILFHRDGAPMRRKRAVTGIHEDAPAWVDTEGHKVDRTQGKRVATQLGQRNSETGELKKGEKDTVSVGMKLPLAGDQRLYMNMQERSDAVGWGTSWRPGEKEISDLVLSGARTKEKANKLELAARYEEANAKNDESELGKVEQDLDKFVKETHPDADEEEVKHIRNEIVDLGTAGGAAAAYRARQNASNQGLHQFVKKHESWPGFSKLLDYHVLPTVDEAYIRPAGQKLDRAIWRVHHPFHDPLRPHVSPLNYNIMPELPSWRYRKRFTRKSPEEVRNLRLGAQVKEMEQSRALIKRHVEADPTKLSRPARLERKLVLRTTDSVMQKSDILTAKTGHQFGPLNRPTVEAIRNEPHLMGQPVTTTEPKDMTSLIAAREKAAAATKKLDERQSAVDGGNKTTNAQERLEYAAKEHAKAHKELSLAEDSYAKASPKTVHTYKVVDSGLPHKTLRGPIKGSGGRALRATGKFGLYGAGAAAVAGLGIYAYDRHKTTQIAQGNVKTKSDSKIPETVSIPKWELYASKKKKLPHNTLTDALDIENETVPYMLGIRRNDKKIRLHNRKDISNEGYKPGPLVGNLRLGQPAANDGSWKNSLYYKQREEGAGRYMEKIPKGKNRYQVSVAGKNFGSVELGKKERWKDVPKNERLKTKNPNKLTADDRELIAMGIISGDNDLRYQYGDDPKVMDLVDNPAERDKVQRKVDYVYAKQGRPLQYQAVQDSEGRWVYEPVATTSAGGVPIQGGGFYMSPAQVESVQDYYHREAERQRAAFESASGHTRVETPRGTFDATGEKSRSSRGTLSIRKDDLVPQLRERELQDRDAYENQQNPHRPV